ncbi:CapA family protein [Desulfobacula sp.]|uniref:CapA family protein n=1 Tax=Desulfobacula sp. TaxID=2593537 RepID=UPI0025B7BB03|nr:CapA family protein [Desulfobacula sp.]MBC2704229.1 CapA family protein [Desulfobacula sp.]
MSKNTKTIVFTGDYHIYGPYDKFIKMYPDHQVFCDDIKDLVSKSDFNVFNLEDPITNSNDGCIKFGPYGVGSKESLVPVKKVGFGMATFATNHTYDMKDEGIKDTFFACKQYGIDVTGAGLTREEAKRVYYKKVGRHNIAILNFSRSEFNAVTCDHGGSNPLDVVQNSRDIIAAKKNADFVFVAVHEGVDVFHLPYPRLVDQMRFYADMGADAIILHHSRIISGYEIYNKVPIFYGLGNLLHLSKNPAEHKGLLVKFSINGKGVLDFEIIPIELDPKKVFVSVCNGDKKNKLIQEVERLSLIIQDQDKLNAEWQKFVLTRKAQYLSIMAGHPRIIPRVTKKIGLNSVYEKILLLNKKKYLAKWNIMKCQAHYEAADYILGEIFKESTK